MNSITSFEPLPRITFSRSNPNWAAIASRKIKSAAVRVKMDALQRLVHRRQRLWRRPERVLVRRQLDDIGRRKPELTGHVLDRLTRFIGNEVAQLGVG